MNEDLANETWDLRGRTVVLTGASSGIGAAAAVRFAELGAAVAVVGRDPDRTAEVAARAGGRAHLADFGSLDGVRRLAAELLDAYKRIDVLANNAGAIFTSRKESPDGYEMTFQVNYLSPFLLTNLLLERLAEAPQGARVINTGSMSYRQGHLDLDDLDASRRRFKSQSVYPNSKLATVLFTRELARRAEGTGVTTATVHPGFVATDIGRDSAVFRVLSKIGPLKALVSSPDRGAQPILRVATAQDTAAFNGAYFNRMRRQDPRPGDQAADPALARELWDRTAEITGLTEAAAG